MCGVVLTLCIYFVALRAKHDGHIAGWRAINLFLGALTTFVGLLMLLLLGTPEEVWWLSPREKLMAKARIVSNSTGGGESHPWKWAQVRECLKDRQYWHMILLNLLACIPNGAITTFQFLVFQTFGFDDFGTILHTIPMYAVTFVITIGLGVSTYVWPRSRFPLAIASQIIGAGVWMFVGTAPQDMNRWAKWGVFLFCNIFVMCLFGLWPMMSLNVAGRTKKSFIGATCFIAFCVGNIAGKHTAHTPLTSGSQIFPAQDAPTYRPGLISSSVILLLNAVNIALWWHYCWKENKRRDRERFASGISEEQHLYENRLAGELDFTDIQNQHFRYAA